MADLKISAATLNPSPAGTDNFATDKAGADFRTTLDQIKAYAAAGGGDVFKVGTPLVDQIGVWTGDGTIKGFAGFEFDGSQFSLPNYSFPVADGAADQVLATDGAGTLTYRDQNRSGGMLSAPYKFSDSIVAADPGPGLVRYNSATPASVTEIYIDDFDENGIDISNLLSLITTDDRIYLQTDKDSSEFLVLNVTAPVTDNTGWFTITGTVEASGNLPADGEDLFIILQIGGASSGHPVSSVFTRTGAVVALQADYDAFFLTPAEGDLAYGSIGDVSANTSKVTNATHTGQMTGATALSAAVSIITAQPAAGVLVGGDTFLVNDGGVLSEITATQMATFFGGGGGQVDSVVSGTNITVDATDPINPIVNLDAAITGVSVNGVSLSDAGAATSYLDETGSYSVPVGTVPPVDSVFTRTGAVVALVGDYSTFYGAIADVSANTAKVTNATHTGQVTGATTLALDVTAVTAQPASGALIGADTFIVNDGGVLSEATMDQLATFIGAGADPLLLSDGLATAPSYSFAGATDMGVFRIGAALGFATAGLTRWAINATELAAQVVGGPLFRGAVAASATVPTIMPNGTDINTGLGWNAADQLSLVAGGVEIARAIEAGTSATDQFFLPRDGAAATPALAIGALGIGFWTGGVAQLNASIGGVRKMFLNSSAFTVDGSIGVEAATGPRMLLEVPSATNPVINVRQNDADTGLGSNAVGSISQISDGEESTRTVAASAGGLQANNQSTGAGLERVLTTADLGGGGAVANDAVQARRTTSFTIIASFGDVTLDATDVETDAAVIEHDAVTDRIVVKETGTYKVEYELDIDNALVSGSDLILVEGRVRLNDAGTGINGSLASTSAFRDTSVGTGNENRFFSHLSNGFIADLTASDFVTLQLNQIPDTGGLEVFTAENVSLQVTRLL
jgi:hypothetical protein